MRSYWINYSVIVAVYTALAIAFAALALG